MIKLWYVNLDEQIFGEYNCDDYRNGAYYIPVLGDYGKVGVNLFSTRKIALDKLLSKINDAKSKLDRFYQECLDKT